MAHFNSWRTPGRRRTASARRSKPSPQWNGSLSSPTGQLQIGILLALGVLVMSVGLIPSGTAGELRILTATGASGVTRSTLAGTTAGRRPVAARMNRGRLIAGDRSGPTGFADEGLHLLRQWSANGNGQLPRLRFRTTAAVEQTQACLIGLLTSQPGCATSCSRRLPKLTTSSTV